MTRWTESDIPDQTGRIVLVTGANSGVGYEAARALAAKNAEVILACRSRERGEEAVARLKAAVPGARAVFAQLDLADLRSVEGFAKEFAAQHDHLDVLINNAGVMAPPEGRTAQGFELQIGVNHLGHFALTKQLLPLLNRGRDARVVVLSSIAATMGSIEFDDLNFTKRGYNAGRAYGQSKLANLLHARELQRRLQASGSLVKVTAAHPGWTATELQRHGGPIIHFFNNVVAMLPPQGALPTLRAATDPAADALDYFGPDGLFEVRGYPKRVQMTKAAKDEHVARRLWEASEALTAGALVPAATTTSEPA